MTKLLIVESPGKVKKLQGILGNQWQVAASVGHVRDLPPKEMGLEPPDFKLQYEPTTRGADVLKRLADLVKKSEEVYLASDPDREGEAIAWHLKDALGLHQPKRVTFGAINDQDVQAGVGSPRAIDMALVRAQEGRRALDRLCGYMVSGPLSNAVGEHLSAGRVQSPALRLVVDREREIRAFVSTTHYGVELTFDAVANISDGWKALWVLTGWLEDGQTYFLDKAAAEKVATVRALTVKDCEEKESRLAPPAPFTTSSLQQAASNALKLDPKATMALAQRLYEQGHITYMRTDSPNLSDAAVAEIRAFCDAQGWPLVDRPRSWKAKEGAQEGHEAIRPTHIEVENAGETDDEKSLYSLIRVRALASQLADAVFDVRVVRLEGEVDARPVIFEAKGRALKEQGWKVLLADDQALADEEGSEPDNPVPALKPGGAITAVAGQLLTKKTQPPSRFTLAALVRELEKRGIGRPATYAAILDTIVSRNYVKEDKRKLVPTPVGEKLIDALKGAFSYLEYDFTRRMEERLDAIAEGKAEYTAVVSEAHARLSEELAKFKQAAAIPCPECASHELRHLKGSKNGVAYDFFSCPDCRNTFPCVAGRPGPKRTGPELTDYPCEKCGKPLQHLHGQKRDGSGEYDFFACSDKNCGMKYDNVDGRPVARKAPDLSEYKCKKCGKPLIARPTKTGGVWYGCSGYSKCKERYWAKEDGSPDYDGK